MIGGLTVPSTILQKKKRGLIYTSPIEGPEKTVYARHESGSPRYIAREPLCYLLRTVKISQVFNSKISKTLLKIQYVFVTLRGMTSQIYIFPSDYSK